MSDISTRLKKVRHLLDLRQVDFANKIGISQGFYTGIENGRYNISSDLIIQLYDVFSINPTWLLTGEGEMFLPKKDSDEKINQQNELDNKNNNENNESNLKPIEPQKDAKTLNNDDFVPLPLVDDKISAGHGMTAYNNIKAFLMFRRDWLLKFGSPVNMSLIEVTGDSMEPTLLPGDVLLINHTLNYLNQNGGIYAITIKSDNLILVKRLQYDFITRKIRIISDNRLYESFMVDPDDIIINGKVVWYGREI